MLAGLPGMPAYPDGVRKKAEREQWLQRHREKGKGMEYHLSCLPEVTRHHLANQAVARELAEPHATAGRAVAALLPPSIPAKPGAVQSLISLKPPQRERVDVRLQILHAADLFLAPYIACQQGEVGRARFVEAYRQRTLPLPMATYAAQRPFSMITLRRWQTALSKAGPAALAGNYGREREGKMDENTALAQFLTALVVDKPHLARKWETLHELADHYNRINHCGWQLPSVSTLRRWLLKWLNEHKVAFTYATNPDAYNNHYRTAIEGMYPWMSRPNDVWEFDSTPVDAFLVDGRHSIIAVIDVYTRRVRLLVAKTSSSEGICLLLRKTLIGWGMLNEGGVMRTDNGSDYVSQRVMSICSLLGINVSRSNAYSGWEKPHIERFFRTLSHGLVELLPSYVGHCVADRQVIEARKSFAQRLEEKRKHDTEKALFELAMTAAELQTLLDNWVEARYHNRKHSALAMSPNDKYRQANYRRQTVGDEAALDLLLNHIGEATVSKGFIKSGGLRYTASELLEHSWKGQRVSVFLDPSDVGRAFLYRSGDWSERVEAINTELLGNGVSPEHFRAAKRADAKALASFRREMRSLAASFGMDQLHHSVVTHMVEQVSTLVPFQRADTRLEHPTLNALGQAAMTPPESVFSAAELAAIERQRETRAARQQASARQQSTLLRSEFEQAMLLAEKQLTMPLSESESGWLKRYLHSHKLMARRIERHLASLNRGEQETGQ